MTDHLEILKDLARNKANCRVIMKAERGALEAAIAAMTSHADRDPQAYDSAETAVGQQMELIHESEVKP